MAKGFSTLNSISEVPVTADQLRDVIDAIGENSPCDEDSLESCVNVIIEVLLEDGIEEQQELMEIGSAICVRLTALAALLGSKPAYPWLAPAAALMLPLPRGPLLEAAATAPLKVEGDCYEFDPETFFDNVLARSPVAGRC